VEELYSLLPLLAIVVLFWLLILRPAQKRQRQTAAMQAALQPGDRIMLSSGIFGTIVRLDDDRAGIRLAEGVEVEVIRAAIGGKDERSVAPEPGAEPGPTGGV
jgi:preprotein translocase subunit YajC